MYVWVCMCGVYNLVGCKACMHNIFVKDERTNERTTSLEHQQQPIDRINPHNNIQYNHIL